MFGNACGHTGAVSPSIGICMGFQDLKYWLDVEDHGQLVCQLGNNGFLYM